MKTHTLKALIATLIIVCAAIWNCSAQMDAGKLADNIITVLKKYFPDKEKDITKWSGQIAASCTPAKDYDSFNKKLIGVLMGDDPNLAWLEAGKNGDNLTKAATDISVAQYPGGAKATKEITSALVANISDGTNIWAQVGIWTGAKFGNPYTIKGNQLTNAGNSSDGYIELSFSSRYVGRTGKDTSELDCDGHQIANQLIFVNPIGHLPDIDTRLGYLFRGSAAPTNYNASTIAGSSDFYSQTYIGVPILRYSSGTDNPAFKQQLTMDIGGGFATDKDHLNLHPNVFFGLGWQGSYLISVITSTNRGYWVGRAGMSLIDQPQITTGATVATNGLGQPDFKLRWAPSVGVEATLPLSSSIALQAGANAYFTDKDPASWNISLGVNLDISKFFGALLKQ